MPRIAALAAAALAALAILALYPPSPARSQERPAITPSRDVDVTYEMANADGSGHVQVLSQRMRWAPEAGLLRVDPPSPGLYVIQDTHAHKLDVVREADRSVMEMASDAASVAPGLARATKFQRGGDQTVAGLACTEWQTEDSGGQPATVCLTSDGVMLRARNAERVLIEARHVAYEHADPSIFQLPEGFKVVRPQR